MRTDMSRKNQVFGEITATITDFTEYLQNNLHKASIINALGTHGNIAKKSYL